jgi:hypothetical protein
MWKIKLSAFIALYFISSCSSIPNEQYRLPSQERVFLIGPLDLITEDPPPTETIVLDGIKEEVTLIGVVLSLFSEVVILEENGGQYRFNRPIAYHPDNTGWGPVSAFLKESEFIELDSWEGPSSTTYCDEYTGCYKLNINSNATFNMEQFPKKGDDCSIQEGGDHGCVVSGRIFKARNYIRLVANNGYEDFFSVNPDFTLCWVHGFEMYKQCLPNNNGVK